MHLVLVFELAHSVRVTLQGSKSVILCWLLAVKGSLLPKKVFKLVSDGLGRVVYLSCIGVFVSMEVFLQVRVFLCVGKRGRKKRVLLILDKWLVLHF